MRDLGFVINPRSHKVRCGGAILTRLADDDIPVLELTDFDDVPSQIRRFAEAGVRRIAIEGGDGTVLAVLSACLSERSGFDNVPQFAVLPGGSTNLAHEVFGLKPKTPEDVRARLAASDGEVVQQRALHVSSEALDHPQVGFLLSTGSLARAMLYVQREFHGEGKRGTRAVAMAILRFLAAPVAYQDQDGQPVLRPTELELDADAVHLSGPHLLSVMTSLPRLSMGLNPFWGAGAGAIAVTHAAWPVTALRRSLLRILCGWRREDLAKRGFTSYRSDMVSLTHNDTLMLDGEALPLPAFGRVEVSLTQPLEFLR